jgi:hypothetical protein
MSSQIRSVSSSSRGLPAAIPPTMFSDETAHVMSDTVDGNGEEELVLDKRAYRRPSQMVEDKLFDLLKDDFRMVSQLRLRSLIARRN